MKLPGMIEIKYENRPNVICHYSKINLYKDNDNYYIETSFDEKQLALKYALHEHYVNDCCIIDTRVSKEEYYRILNLFKGFSTEETKQINITEAFNKFTKENYPDGVPLGATVSIKCEDGNVKIKDEGITPQQIPEKKPWESFVVMRESFVKQTIIETIQEFYQTLKNNAGIQGVDGPGLFSAQFFALTEMLAHIQQNIDADAEDIKNKINGDK
jgi:hypothetical protein